MPRCRGKNAEGTQCKFNAAEKDNRCLAHKLKTLPRELVEHIFSFLLDIRFLKTYSNIFTEALPVYFRRKLQDGSAIAFEMLEMYETQEDSDEDCSDRILHLIMTRDQKNIEKAVWRLLFLNRWSYATKKLFIQARNYIALPLTYHRHHKEIIKSATIKKSFLDDRVLPEAKREIEMSLLRAGPGFQLTVDQQMANLLCLILTAYSICLPLSIWPKKSTFDSFVKELCEIHPYNKAFFSKQAYVWIWRDS